MPRTVARSRADRSRSAVSRRPYTTNEELGALIRAYRLAGKRMRADKHARLLEVLQQIAGGVWDRWQPTDSREDFVQDCLYLFLHSALRLIDPKKKPFSYLTTTAVNHGWAKRRQQVKRVSVEQRRQAAITYYGRDVSIHHFPDLD